MNSKKVTSALLALVSLASVPVLWFFGFSTLPSVSSLDTGKGSAFGPLLFTWGLIVLASGAALLIAWQCFASGSDTASVEHDTRRLEKA